jgi:BTB/POZ domain
LLAQRNRTTLSLYLCISERYPNPYYNAGDYTNLNVKYEMKLKTRCGDFANKSKGQFKQFDYNGHRLGKITSTADLNKSNSWRWLDNNSIEIVIDLEIIEAKKNVVGVIPKNICELSNQYETLYCNEKYSDFILITADQEEIPVHKNILSSRSPVFEVNFS